MNSFALVCILLSFFLISCGKDHPAPVKVKVSAGHIVGGTPVPTGLAPWQVSLQYKNGNHFCGGSVIGKRVIVTAAHCLQNMSPKDLQVAGGGHDGKLASQKLLPAVDKILMHEGWTGGYADVVNHDIALVILKSDIGFHSMLRPIALPTARAMPYLMDRAFELMGARYLASGWGDTRVTADPDRPLLGYEITPLASALNTIFWDFEAQHRYIKLDFGRRFIGGNFLVSMTIGKSTCGGDSGGPLALLKDDFIFQDVLVGLTSAGGDSGCTNVVFHTNLQHYLDWIAPHLK